MRRFFTVEVSQLKFRPGNDRIDVLSNMHLTAHVWLEDGNRQQKTTPFGRFAFS